MEEQAILKFNDGAGALLCSGCNRIISTGSSFTEKEWMAMQGKLDLPPQYCKDCREVSKNGNNETVTSGHVLTAVEWLIEAISLANSIVPDDSNIKQHTIDSIYKQAKAMEREQIMMAFNDGKVNAVLNKRNSSQYYTETYQPNKN
jgi:hypothetical protein